MSPETFEIIKKILEVVNVFFVIYLIGYSTFLFLSVVIGSSELYKKHKQEKLQNAITETYYIPISIIVPAHNEEVTVVETVHSLLALEYTTYEIVVVDDGSTDQTAQKLIEAYNMKPLHRPIHRRIECQPEEFVYESVDQKVPITLIRKKNGGKADSLNMGINACRFPYFICMDADSVLQYDSLFKISRPIIENPNVVAVGGVVRPSNSVTLENGRVLNYRLPKSIIASMQVLEYDRSFLASRIMFDKYNGSLIISGAFGLFKKETVITVGGYDHSTMGEDMELVVKLHEFCRASQTPYLIKYANDAVCWSQAPEKLRDLRRQRKRWHIGLFQTMWKHRVLFLNPKYGAVSLISYLYFLIYELLSPFIEIFGIATVVAAYVTDLLNVPFMILFFLIYAVFGCILTITAFFARTYTADLKVTAGEFLKAALLCFFETSVLRFIMAWVRATAFIGYKHKKLHWGKIERKQINIK